MGVDTFDGWALAHFAGGVLYRIVVFPNNPILSFTLSTFIHLLGELAEQHPHPLTGAAETTKNHYGDMFAFMLGWVVGCWVNQYIPPYRDPLWKSWRFWLLLITMIITTKEFLREIIMTDNKTASGLLY